MKRTGKGNLDLARSWLAIGEQVLVVWFEHHGREQGGPAWRCAKLFDSDEARLRKTARELGIGSVMVSWGSWAGEDGYLPACHIDVFGRPLQRALALCGEEVGRGRTK